MNTSLWMRRKSNFRMPVFNNTPVLTKKVTVPMRPCQKCGVVVYVGAPLMPNGSHVVKREMIEPHIEIREGCDGSKLRRIYVRSR